MNTNDDNFNMMMTNISITDATEADELNDETFGNCDLETIKIKSDFGENGEFLGDSQIDDLPAFFDTDTSDSVGISLADADDESQQPSIDALLGEDPMHFAAASLHRQSGSFVQQSTMHPLFNMAISQAQESNRVKFFPQQDAHQQPQPQLRPRTRTPAPAPTACSPWRPPPRPMPQTSSPWTMASTARWRHRQGRV